MAKGKLLDAPADSTKVLFAYRLEADRKDPRKATVTLDFGRDMREADLLAGMIAKESNAAVKAALQKKRDEAMKVNVYEYKRRLDGHFLIERCHVDGFIRAGLIQTSK